MSSNPCVMISASDGVPPVPNRLKIPKNGSYKGVIKGKVVYKNTNKDFLPKDGVSPVPNRLKTP